MNGLGRNACCNVWAIRYSIVSVERQVQAIDMFERWSAMSMRAKESGSESQQWNSSLINHLVMTANYPEDSNTPGTLAVNPSSRAQNEY